MAFQIEQHELRVVLDAAGQVAGGSAVTTYSDGTYRVVPLTPGPFDTPEDALREGLAALEFQKRLW